jgi:hypothetical protein
VHVVQEEVFDLDSVHNCTEVVVGEVGDVLDIHLVSALELLDLVHTLWVRSGVLHMGCVVLVQLVVMI